MEANLHSLSPESEKLDEHFPHPLAKAKRIRRRGREISSRYMLTASPFLAPSSPIHPSSTSTSVSEPSSHYADENNRSFDTNRPLGVQDKAPDTQRRCMVRLFSENTGDFPETHIVEHYKGITESRSFLGRPRVGTPTAPDCSVAIPRPVLYSQIPPRLTKKTATHEVNTKALTPFPPENSSIMADSGTECCSISSLGGLCHSPSIQVQSSCRAGQASVLRSSMPEADLMPTRSTRQSEAEELMFRRSLNSALSSSQRNPFNLAKTVNSKVSVPEMFNFGRIFLPPQPLSSRSGLDLKKGKKGSSRKEDVHVLYLLHNQYLQWRFVNAKAKVASKARVITAERSLCEVSKILKELRDSVIVKRMELEKLKRLRRLSNILNVEMPYLEEWVLADREYSASLSGTIKSLQDASTILPVIGDVRVDVKELKEAIHLVTSMFESFSPSIWRFLLKADGVVKLITELAKVASREEALIEECGCLLSEVQGMQVKECSLRSILMQAKRSSII